MSSKRRFNVVTVLGLLYVGLIFHNVSSFRLGVILDYRSLGYVWNRLPGTPLVRIAAVVVASVALIAVVWFANKRLSRRGGGSNRQRLVTAFYALGFLAAGGGVLWMNPRFPAPQEWSGLAAALSGAALILFASFTARRRLIAGHAILLVVTVALLLTPHLSPGHREDTRAIERFVETALGDLERRARAWPLADPDAVLAEAGERAARSEVYRFDEHLEDVTRLEAHREVGGRGVLFEIPRDGRLVAAGPGASRSEISGGAQVFPDYRGGSVLRTKRPLALAWSEVGAIRITMKVSNGSYFLVYWGERAWDAQRGIRIPLAPPGRSASYVIREKIIRHRGEGDVEHIWIVPSERDARVEVETFQVLDRAGALLRGAPFAAGYENIGDEIRRVLFVSTPGRLTYRVGLPARNPRLRFGIGTLDGGVPTTFQVTIGHRGREQTAFSKAWQDAARWSDHELDLSPWAGETVDVSFVTASPGSNLGMWSNPVLLGQPAPAPNVVIYLVDCLRPDHLGAYGYGRNTSPVFDGFSAAGTLFERAYSNGPTTKLSLPSLFTSNPISATGVRHDPDVLPEAFPTLAEILRTMGYATTAFATNGNAGPFSGTHQGFCVLYGGKRIIRAAGPGFDDSDAEALVGDLMREWLERNKNRNFFMYIHTMDAHGVYDPPPEYRHFYRELESGTPVPRNEMFDPPWVETPTREGRMALYDGEIAYGDAHFGRFVRMLDEAGVLENTVIVFTADHGEYFGEHRLWGHVAPCFRQGTRIPLLLVGPGIARGVRVAQNVQILDIVPTILDAVGLEPDPVLFQGRSLLPLARGQSPQGFDSRVIFVESEFPGETAFYCGDYHLLPEKNLIFDLSTDPQERRYLNSFLLDFALKSRARRLSETHHRTYEALKAAVAPAGGDALEVDPETLEQLRALGYIQ